MAKPVGLRQIPLRLAAPVEASFEDFVPGPNAACVATVRAAASHANEVWPLLWGESGSGKSHLLMAAATVATAAGRRAAYLTAAVLSAHSPEVLDSLNPMDLVCLDDIEQLLGDPDWELALFALFNRLREQGGVLIISSGRQPQSWAVDLPDLRSRLLWGTTLALKPLNDDDKSELLQRRARSKGSQIEAAVIRYLMAREPRSISYLMGALDYLIDAGFSEKRRITIPLARTYLAKMKALANMKESANSNDL